MGQDKQPHLIILTRGREDGGQAAVMGLKLALSLQALDHPVAIFLTLGATRWGLSGTASDVQAPGEPTLEEFFDAFLESDGDLMLCSPCVSAYCSLPSTKQDDLQRSLRPQARYVGLATVAERLIRGRATAF